MCRRQTPMTTRERWALRSSAPSIRWCQPAGICTSLCSPTATTKTTSTQTTWHASWKLSKRYTVSAFDWQWQVSLQACLCTVRSIYFFCYPNPAYYIFSHLYQTMPQTNGPLASAMPWDSVHWWLRTALLWSTAKCKATLRTQERKRNTAYSCFLKQTFIND